MKTITFDIETIQPDWSDEEKFAPLPYHKPVVISLLETENGDPHGVESYLVHPDHGEERAVLASVVERIAMADRLISFNGRSFDLPVIMLRAMAHGINTQHIQARAHRFEMYRKPLWHHDVLELATNFGAGQRFKLDALCAMLDLPGKPMEIDGSKVGEAWEADPLLVAWYCEDDVLQTHLAYLYWQASGGGAKREKIDPVIATVRSMLAHHRSKKS